MKSKMKTIYTIVAAALVFSVSAQQQKKNDQLFDNWFANQPTPQYAAPPPPPNTPGVPIDGGLIGLIAAGGAMGYRKYKQKANKEG